MYQQTYFVDKTTDTFADTLLAYGVATLLDRLLDDNGGKATVRVKDEGGVFAIALERPILAGFEKVSWFCDLPFIQTKSKKGKKLPECWSAAAVEYDLAKQQRSDYLEARKRLPVEARRPGAAIIDHPALAALPPAPRPDWDVLSQINQMFAITAYAQVLEAWFECRVCFPDLLRLILKLFAATPNNEAEALASWKALVRHHSLKAKETATPVQVLNPAMGKGINRPKTDGADHLDNPDSFWVLEFLKFWGMRVAGAPRIIQSAQAGGGRGPRDRKTYVLHPVNISLDTHQSVYKKFSQSMWSNTAVKMDVLAALRYTDVFLEQWLAGQVKDVSWGQEPGDCINGLTTAFYKDMGNAVALLNLSEVALPRWMRVDDHDDGQLYRSLLEEHRRVVTSLRERNADEYRLLVLYRDFLSGHDLRAFFEFIGAFSTLLMSRLERGDWAPRFLTTNLEVLIMGHDRKLKPILDTPGFQNIAAAIRLSTVRPQFFKAKTGKAGPYDIRYGLGTELLRQAAYPDRFIQALSTFMHAYNQETEQVFERFKGEPRVRRPRITTDDIAQVAALIDGHGSQTVGNLLVAFGYAREPREQEPGETQPQVGEDNEDNNA